LDGDPDCFQPRQGKLAGYCRQQDGDAYRDFAILFKTHPSVVLQIVKQIVGEYTMIYLQPALALSPVFGLFDPLDGTLRGVVLVIESILGVL
jgi:hypothetical protein